MTIEIRTRLRGTLYHIWIDSHYYGCIKREHHTYGIHTVSTPSEALERAILTTFEKLKAKESQENLSK